MTKEQGMLPPDQVFNLKSPYWSSMYCKIVKTSGLIDKVLSELQSSIYSGEGIRKDLAILRAMYKICENIRRKLELLSNYSPLQCKIEAEGTKNSLLELANTLLDIVTPCSKLMNNVMSLRFVLGGHLKYYLRRYGVSRLQDLREWLSKQGLKLEDLYKVLELPTKFADWTYYVFAFPHIIVQSTSRPYLYVDIEVPLDTSSLFEAMYILNLLALIFLERSNVRQSLLGAARISIVYEEEYQQRIENKTPISVISELINSDEELKSVIDRYVNVIPNTIEISSDKNKLVLGYKICKRMVLEDSSVKINGSNDSFDYEEVLCDLVKLSQLMAIQPYIYITSNKFNELQEIQIFVVRFEDVITLAYSNNDLLAY